VRNQWLIACECHARGITPTYVAGYRAFLALNRCVRKGETTIKILAPVAVKQRNDSGEETGEKRIFFRTVPVFDTLSRDRLGGSFEPPGLEPASAATGVAVGMVAPIRGCVNGRHRPAPGARDIDERATHPLLLLLPPSDSRPIRLAKVRSSSTAAVGR
jgi:hypothetical protein